MSFAVLKFDMDRNLLVVDHGEVQTFNPNSGELLRKFNVKGRVNSDEDVVDLLVVAVDTNNNLLFSDGWKGRSEPRIQLFTPTGEFIKSIGIGILKSPIGIAIDISTGNLIIADRSQSHLQVFTSSGQALRTLATRSPLGVMVDRDGNILVMGITEVRIFSSEGKFLQEFHIHGVGAPAFHPNGAILISDGTEVAVYGETISSSTSEQLDN